MVADVRRAIRGWLSAPVLASDRDGRPARTTFRAGCRGYGPGCAGALQPVPDTRVGRDRECRSRGVDWRRRGLARL